MSSLAKASKRDTPTSRIPIGVKYDAMMMWARGEQLTDVAEILDLPHKTLKNWKQQNIPESWFRFRQKLVKEATAAALQEIRIAAAQEVRNHWTDLTQTRRILRQIADNLEIGLEIEMAKAQAKAELAAADRGEDLSDVRAAIPSGKLDLMTNQARKLVTAQKLLQEQQFVIAQLKWLSQEMPQLDDEETGEMTDEQLNRLKPEELLQVALAATKDQPSPVDVTPSISNRKAPRTAPKGRTGTST